MSDSLKLGTIPSDQFSDYRYNVIFDAYKWDPQVEDHDTIARQVILITPQLADQLERWAEELSAETILMEEALLHSLPLSKELGIPRKIQKALRTSGNYESGQHPRLMRFDFHPTTDGWAVSEVNSDVPGGLAEASILSQIAASHFPGFSPGRHIGQSLLEAFRSRIESGGVIALVHATSYSDDRQVMQFLGDYFAANGYSPLYAAPDHLRWNGNQATSIVEGSEGPVDGILRFFPLEWLVTLPRNTDWQGYFSATTPSCNHPVAMLSQSKRLPLVWDRLGIDIPTWKMLLPETVAPGKIGRSDGWIFKPALGRVGENITIRDAVSQKELKKLERSASIHPKNWIAQRMFHSAPLTTDEGETFHLCLGVFTVDGKRAGFYGRISPFSRIDSRAKDIPVLVADMPGTLNDNLGKESLQ